MSDTAQMESDDLEEERDALMDQLVVLSGDLKRFGYDFTKTVDSFLNDTAAATAANNQRLKRRVDSWKELLEKKTKEKAPPTSPPPPSQAVVKRPRPRIHP